MKGFMKKNWHYVLSLLIPFLIMVVHVVVRKLWFAGPGGILNGDAMVQILPIYNELWNKVHSGASLSYTWNIGGGVDFYGVLVYAMSPFSILMLVVPKDQIANMLQFTITCKWALVSLTSTMFFYKTRFNQMKECKKLLSMFLGLAVCLSNAVTYLMGYPQNMDPMICFPILLLLVEKLFEEKKWKLYYAVLSLSMITSIYTSYAICIFLCLWFIFLCEKKYKGQMKEIFVKFALSSVMAAVTAFVSIYPLLQLSAGRISNSDSAIERSLYATRILVYPVDFIKQLFFYNELEGAASLIPNIYVSITAIVLVPLFVLIKMDRRRKYKLLAMVGLLILSIQIGAISLFWHVFTPPNGVYHRHIYMLVIMLMLVVLQVVKNLEQITPVKLLIVGAVELVTFAVTFFMIKVYASFVIYLVTLLLLIFGMIVLFLYARKSFSYKQIVTLLVVIGTAELSVNAFHALDHYKAVGYDDVNAYGAVLEFEDRLEVEPGERILSVYANNFGPFVDCASEEGFLSSINQNNLILQNKLGLGISGHVAYTQIGGTPLINLMYNIRYGISYRQDSFSDTEEAAKGKSTNLYRMKRLAGLGYMVNDSILDWDIEAGDCFDIQNDFVNLAVDGKDFLKRVEVDLSTKDASGEGLVFTKTPEKEYCIYYTTKYSSMYDAIQAEFVADHDMDLYVYTVGDYDMNNYFHYYIYIDEELAEIDTRGCATQTMHIGNVKKGQTVSIVKMPSVERSLGDDTYWGLVFGEFDEEAYAASYEKLSKNVLQVDTFEDDYVKGTIHADEKGVMLTSILADENFEVTVDGEKKDYEVVADTLIAVPLEEGDHVVEFQYSNDMLIRGLMGSGVGVILFVIVCFLEPKLFRKKNQGEAEETLDDDSGQNMQEMPLLKEEQDLVEEIMEESNSQENEE